MSDFVLEVPLLKGGGEAGGFFISIMTKYLIGY